jgi:hypothetical protein
MVTRVEWYDKQLLISIVSHCPSKICNNFLSSTTGLEISSGHYLWVKIYTRILSCSMKSFLLHVPTCKMPNLLDTNNTYIEYIY